MTQQQLIEIAEKSNKWLDDISAEYHIDKIELQDIIKQFLRFLDVLRTEVEPQESEDKE